MLTPDYTGDLDRALKILNILIFFSKYLRVIVAAIVVLLIVVAAYAFASANIAGGALAALAAIGVSIFLLRIATTNRPAQKRQRSRITGARISDAAA